MKLTIPTDDHGKIRVFSISTPMTDALRDKDPATMQELFGTSALDTDFVDTFEVSALGEMTTSDYIQQGYDFKPDAADLVALNGLQGTAALIMSRATEGQDITLKLAPEVSHVTTLGDAASLSPKPAPESVAAKEVTEQVVAKKAPSDAAMSGRVATIVLVILFALVALMIWVAA